MKKLFLVAVIVLLISGCSKEKIDYSFFIVDKAATYVLEVTEESMAEFESENSNLIKDYSETEKQELYKFLAPSLTIYAEDENIFSCFFDFASMNDYASIENQWYVISEKNNTLTVYIKYYSESDTEYKYVFEIIDEHTLKYLQSESSEFRYVEKERISLNDGAMLICEEK